MNMKNKFCPVCDYPCLETAKACSVCGWDFSPVLAGSQEEAQRDHETRLAAARAAWRGVPLSSSHARIVVDIGGSGVRLARVKEGGFVDLRRAEVDSMERLAAAICAAANGKKIGAVAVSMAGFVDADTGRVRLSRVAPWSQGNFAAALRARLKVDDVFVINDGEAHTRALYADPAVEFGALCLAMGTSVALGAIDGSGRIMRTLSGENWDVGALWLKTRASDPHVWWALGSHGLAELTEGMGEKGYAHFGYRLGFFLAQLTTLFRPATIALAGGIIRKHFDRMEDTIQAEMKANIHNIPVPKIVALKERETALVGLVNLLTQPVRRLR
jgi:predicted NBD/HSP70 family sugar kinase